MNQKISTIGMLEQAESEIAEGRVHTLRYLSDEGDTVVTWDVVQEAEVIAARATFERLAKQGYEIFDVNAKGEAGQVRHFDPELLAIVAVPRMVGG